MSDIKISVDSTTAPGSDKEVTVIRVDGVIDTMTATELEKVANSLLSQKKYNIIVDLGGVDYISSAGWGIFISNIREIRLNDGDIKLARMIPNVYEIFELLEFDSILKAFDNLEKAKADFAGAVPAEQTRVEILEPKPVTVGKQSSDGLDAQLESGRQSDANLGSAPSTEFGENAGNPDSPRIKNENTTAEPGVEQAPASVRKFEDAIMEIIGKDPFLSVGEIKNAVLKEFPRTGFLKTWWTLRKLGLSSKKKRFYFARTRRFTK